MINRSKLQTELVTRKKNKTKQLRLACYRLLQYYNVICLDQSPLLLFPFTLSCALLLPFPRGGQSSNESMSTMVTKFCIFILDFILERGRRESIRMYGLRGC